MMINDENGSISIESVFDTLLRMGLVMQMTVLTVTIVLTIVVVFLWNVGIGALISKAIPSAPPWGFLAAVGLVTGNDYYLQPKLVNATQQGILSWLKWNP